MEQILRAVLTEGSAMVEQMDHASGKPPTFTSHRFEG
jgi:hypothetical protein